ncbi:MAG: hypothetical protein AAFP10_09315, partial [Pseudomonadota bacterium]
DRLAYEKYKNDQHYQASMTESSYGFGKWEGRKEGIQEGRKEGIQEGMKKQKLEIATNLLAASTLDAKTIATMTSLTLQELEELKEKVA